MAFDRENPAHLTELYTEITIDPATIPIGYGANTSQNLKLINDPASNTGGETAARPFDVRAMLDALDVAELGANQLAPGTMNFVHILAEVAAYDDIAAWKSKFRAAFDVIPNSSTVTALDAQTAALSRAEALWGQGSVITRDDWAAAVEANG